MSEMKLRFSAYDELMPISEMEDSPFQRTKHTKEQIKQLAKIMRVEGVDHPISITKGTKRICFGHGRRDSAKENKWTHFPVVYVSFDNEDQEWRRVQSDNAIAMQAELDLASINLDLADFGPFDVELLGLKDFEPEPADKYGDQDADAVPKQRSTNIKLGDLYQLGDHRLLCGDSTDHTNVELLMNGEKADMVYTDPPYGFGYDGDFYQKAGGDLTKTRSGNDTSPRKVNKFRKLEGDTGNWDFDPRLILEFFKNIDEIYLWGADYYAQKLPIGGSWICWNKVAGGEALDNMPGASFELCWSRSKHKRRMAPVTWRGCFGHNKKNDGPEKVHPTQKPIALHDWFFGHYGKEKANIVDLYLGSGSTLIACEKTNRKCFGMEIDPQYTQVIIDRWEKFTGLKAVKIEETVN